jgi:hypothetical protein
VVMPSSSAQSSAPVIDTDSAAFKVGIQRVTTPALKSRPPNMPPLANQIFRGYDTRCNITSLLWSPGSVDREQL